MFLACRLCFYVRYGIISEEPSQRVRACKCFWLTGYVFMFGMESVRKNRASACKCFGSPRASVFGLSVMFLCSLWNHFGRTEPVHANALAHRLYFFGSVEPRVRASVFGLSVMFLCSLWNHFGRTEPVHANALAHRLYFFGSVEPARACTSFDSCFCLRIRFVKTKTGVKIFVCKHFESSVFLLFYVTWLLPLSA